MLGLHGFQGFPKITSLTPNYLSVCLSVCLPTFFPSFGLSLFCFFLWWKVSIWLAAMSLQLYGNHWILLMKCCYIHANHARSVVHWIMETVIKYLNEDKAQLQPTLIKLSSFNKQNIICALCANNTLHVLKLPEAHTQTCLRLFNNESRFQQEMELSLFACSFCGLVSLSSMMSSWQVNWKRIVGKLLR